MTTSDYLEQLTQDRDDLVDNLTTKGITGLTGDETFTELVPEVLNIPTGGGTTEVEEKDVMFYDYDGTPLYSYTKQEFLALESMPENPTHEGLTAQGWNWSLQEAQDYLNEGYTLLDIGQLYITDDEKTRIYLDLEDGDRLSLYLCIAMSSEITIDWGDGTSETATGSTNSNKYIPHTYSTSGKYVISIDAGEGNIKIFAPNNAYERLLMLGNTNNYTGDNNNYFAKRIYKIELGKNVSIQSYAFRDTNIKTINIPSYTFSGNYLFYNCYNLKALIIPKPVSSNVSFTLYSCYSLEKIVLPNNKFSDNTIGTSLQSIKRFVNYKNNTLGQLNTMNNLKITEYAGTSTYTGNFQNNLSIETVYIKNLSSINTNYFQGCTNLKKVSCENVTAIYSNGFSNCVSLTNLKFGDVTLVKENVFSNCVGMKKYDFTNCTQVPELSNINAFYNIPTDCKIVVPDSLYNDWIVATNWSDTSIVDHIISQSDYEAL